MREPQEESTEIARVESIAFQDRMMTVAPFGGANPAESLALRWGANLELVPFKSFPLSTLSACCYKAEGIHIARRVYRD